MRRKIAIDRLVTHGSRSTRHRVVRPRFVSAGQVLAVGLLCFGVWLGLDARQLYTSASASPLGVRRSVAMSILRPIARTEEFLGIDRVMDGTNRALGRNGLTPGGMGSFAAPPAFGSTTAPGSPKNGARPAPSPSHVVSPTTIPSHAAVPQIPRPTPAHPITVLEIGDSIGEDLGDGLGDVIGSDPSVRLIPAAVGDTGLANVAYFNWQANLLHDIAEYHPQIVIVLLGGNDWQSFSLTPTKNAVLGTALWHTAYAARVGDLISEATSHDVQMFWVGLPVMGPASLFPPSMATTLNSIYAQEVHEYADAYYVSSWRLFTNAAGHYSQYLPNAHGSLVQIRDPDGVHLALPGGSDLLAHLVVSDIDRLDHVKL